MVREDGQSPKAKAQDQAFDWFVRIQTEPGNTSLKAELDQWCARDEMHRDAYASVTRMLAVAKALPAGYADAACRSVSSARPRNRLSIATHRRVWRAAAGFAILTGLLGAALFNTLRTPTVPGTLHATAVAETREVILDDGSLLYLDAETRIRAATSAMARTVELISGQAYFDVVPDRDRPFVIDTADMTVTVTGTRFAVSNRGDRIVVAVASGSVETAYDMDAAKLAAGDRMVLNRSTRMAETSAVDPDSVGAFRTGRILVENMAFGDLLKQLDAYFDGEIWLGDVSLADRRVSGSFDLGAPGAALRAAAGSQGAIVRTMSPGVLAVFAR